MSFSASSEERLKASTSAESSADERKAASAKADEPEYYTKIVKLFSDCLLEYGYEEPEYHAVQTYRHEEAPGTFVEDWYDIQGKKRKSFKLGHHRRPESIEARDEYGRLIASMVIAVGRKTPHFLITLHTWIDGYKVDKYKLGTRDYVLKRDLDDGFRPPW
ncbi:MAG: hypothetical protein J6K32_09835 [Clostridia bacterium]|nr:hypothetical protein [Clostridia bacterium]